MHTFQRFWVSLVAATGILTFLAGTGAHIPAFAGWSLVVVVTLIFTVAGPRPRQ